MAEILGISDLRQTHKDIPTSLDTALKYALGAKVCVSSCEVSITEGSIGVSDGEVQYGNKRYSIAGTSSIPYCFSDGDGGVSYQTYGSVPCVWDDQDRSPMLLPPHITVGCYANYWLYAVLSTDIEEGDPEELGVASVIIVLGDTLYYTEREAKTEYVPHTTVVPTTGELPTYATMGNIVPFARVTIGVTVWGDGPVYTSSISQPMAFWLDTPPRPEINDIPDSLTTVVDYNEYSVTELDRNRDLAVAHHVDELVLSSTITLTSASKFGEGYWIRVLNLSKYSIEGEGLFIEPDGADTIVWNKNNSADYLYSNQAFSCVRLISDGVSSWMATDFSGVWLDETDYPYLFDGNIEDGDEDNVVTIDANGNIQDSGISIDDIGGGSSKSIERKTGDYTVLVGDANGTVFNMSAGSTPTTLTLEASPANDRNITIFNFGSGVVTVDPNGNDINGSSSDIYLGQYDSIELIYDATDEWIIIG